MLPYLFMYIIIVLSWIYTKLLRKNIDKRNYIISSISFVCLVVLLGLRNQNMGIDLNNTAGTGYLASFEVISEMSLLDVIFIDSFLNYDKGFVIFNNLIGTLYQDRQFFLIMCSVVSMSTVFYAIYKKSTNVILSVIIFIGIPSFLYNFSALRQALAMSICFLSLVYIIDKNPLRFFLLVVLASTFHFSAALFFVAYPIFYMKIDLKTRLVSILLFSIVFLLRVDLTYLISKILNRYIYIVDTGAINLMIVLISIYVCCTFTMDYKNSIQNGLLNIYYIACVSQIFGGIHNLAARVTVYFLFPLILLLPMILENIKNFRYRYICTMFIFLAFLANGLFGLYRTYWAMAYPYYFCWETI